MKMKKWGALLLAVVVSLVALAGCGAKTEPAETEPAKAENAETNEAANPEEPKETEQKKIKIGFSVMDLSNQYFVDLSNGAQEYCDEMGYELIVSDPASDTSKQVSNIENFIAAGCDAILVAALDAESCEGIIGEAVAQGIPVITETTLVNTATQGVIMDEYSFGHALGVEAGKWIAENFKDGKAEFAILNQPTLVQVIDRENGIKDGILENAPNATCVATVAAWLNDSGMKAAEEILEANPNCKVICGINDAGALGAMEAVIAAGKDTDDFFIGGGDASPEALQRIKDGTIYRATVGFDIANKEVGKILVQQAVKALNGEKLEPAYYLNILAANSENVQEFIDRAAE